MSRLRGNARKKKARLTDHTLTAVMQVARRTDVAEAPPAQDAALDSVELDILALLRAEPDTAAAPSVYNDTARVFTGASDFPADRFVFGLMSCPQCHNEMVYYQRRERLSEGYHFRCRVCQHEVLASLT